MNRFLIVLFLVFALMPYASKAQTTQNAVVATGDSYTRRIPCQSSDYPYCDMTYQILHDQSYATYLNPATFYQVTTSYNSGRGGDTCTTQVAFQSGPSVGQPRGLKANAADRINAKPGNIVSILIGINDINVYNVNVNTIRACLSDLYAAVSGKKIVALTYPPISTSTTVWSIGGVMAEQNRLALNSAIRTAVTGHNFDFPNKPVRLVELGNLWTDPSQYTVDGAHPNAKGAILMAKKWLQDVCGGTPFITNCILY